MLAAGFDSLVVLGEPAPGLAPPDLALDELSVDGLVDSDVVLLSLEEESLLSASFLAGEPLPPERESVL